jgi:putative transposase
VLNRGAGRRHLFRTPADDVAFLRILDEALERTPTRLLGSCLMSTPWHVVVWPEADGQLTRLLRWLTLTHAVRWHTPTTTQPVAATSTRTASRVPPSR